MKDVLRDPVQLIAQELGAVIGGFGHYFSLDFTLPRQYTSAIEGASEQRLISGNGNGSGDFDTGNGNGNNNGNV